MVQVWLQGRTSIPHIKVYLCYVLLRCTFCVSLVQCPSEQDLIRVFESNTQQLYVVDRESNATCSISRQGKPDGCKQGKLRASAILSSIPFVCITTDSQTTAPPSRSSIPLTQVSSCGVVYQLCRQVMLDLKVTSTECLNQSSTSTQTITNSQGLIW